MRLGGAEAGDLALSGTASPIDFRAEDLVADVVAPLLERGSRLCGVDRGVALATFDNLSEERAARTLDVDDFVMRVVCRGVAELAASVSPDRLSDREGPFSSFLDLKPLLFVEGGPGSGVVSWPLRLVSSLAFSSVC